MRDDGRAIRRRVGSTIRRLRMERALTQEGLAERVGNSWKHVGQIERGEVNVGLDVLARIAGALSVNIAELFPEPRGRRRVRGSAYLTTGDDLQQIEAVVRRIKWSRPTRASK
jgi:transcriptional regulator with XRE-family HTH domain